MPAPVKRVQASFLMLDATNVRSIHVSRALNSQVECFSQTFHYTHFFTYFIDIVAPKAHVDYEWKQPVDFKACAIYLTYIIILLHFSLQSNRMATHVKYFWSNLLGSK